MGFGCQAAELGRLSEARAIYERALQCNPRHLLLLENLMSVQMLLGDWDAAAHLARRLLLKVRAWVQQEEQLSLWSPEPDSRTEWNV